MSLLHPIQVAARLSGLSPHVIRIWEKRYRAVTPARTESNRRLYSDDEVERLCLLARATGAGHTIGIIARLGLPELKRLVATVAPQREPGPSGNPSSAIPGDPKGASGIESVDGSALATARVGTVASARLWPLAAEDGAEAVEPLVRAAVEATRTFSAGGLVEVLERGAVRFGHNGVLHRVVCPLAQRIGDHWQRGELTAAHEHFASALIRDTLARTARPFGTAEGAPRAIVATPAGQLHELGAVIVSAAATNLGWRPVFLGASLPAAEIAGAALQNQARAVLLSIVYPSDDRELPGELQQLRRFLPASVVVVVGGRAAPAYEGVLREIGAVVPEGLQDLCRILGDMRREAWGADSPRTRDGD